MLIKTKKYIQEKLPFLPHHKPRKLTVCDIFKFKLKFIESVYIMLTLTLTPVITSRIIFSSYATLQNFVCPYTLVNINVT
jgi:hypothetical protein